MPRRVWSVAVAAVLAGAAAPVAVGPALAVESNISGPATAREVAVRGEQVQVNPPPAQPATATYRITLNARWTAASHPGTTPGNAHFSPPVIAVHAVPGAMFELGSPASPGIESMAERGRTATLISELRSNPQVTQSVAGSGIPAPAISTRSFDISATQSADLVSLVTMLAPSSDWFVGLRNFDLFDGEWIGSTTIAAGNYDAGTADGSNFGFCCDTLPRGVVTGPVDAGFIAAAAQNPFATITITRTG